MALKKRGRGFFKKFWHFLWKDNSFKGWVFSLAFLFIFIKLIFFPILSLATGTSLPLAIVESCSMYHKGNLFSDLNTWWDRQEDKYSKFEIDKLDFQKFSMENGFNKGDILLILRANPEKLNEGDIIIFNADQKNPVIHRIIEIKEKDGEKVFSTIGDNNAGQFNFEKEIMEERLVGKAVLKLAPYIGWVKLIFYEWGKPFSERGLCNEK
ncbi:MAG TPA: signal peptidase I [Bacillota bacterium]|nr:signal peptidase I [Bacillota bacterium]